MQKSNNSKDWQDIATVKGSGNSSTTKTYNAIDNNPFNGINYYRIKQTDNNGSYTFSQIKQVTINDKQQPINIYPNPATDIITINCTNAKHLSIVDYLGRVVYTNIDNNINRLSLNINHFAKGVYVVVIETANDVITKKIVKE